MNRRQFLQRLRLMAGIAMAATAAPARADQWSKSYQVSGHADLHVMTDDGDVTITRRGPASNRRPRYHRRFQDRPERCAIIESQSGEQRLDRSQGAALDFSLFGGNHNSLRVEMRVPRELDLNVRTSDGNVNALGVSGNIQFDTGDGHVTANGIKGDITHSHRRRQHRRTRFRRLARCRHRRRALDG